MANHGLDYEINLLRKLVEINTTVTADSRKGYEECSEIIRLEAQQLGLRTEVLNGQSVTIDGEPRPNVVITLEGTSDVDLLLVTHLDVVPADSSKWKTPPFQLRVKNNRAYGRGAADNKSNITAALGAMGQLAENEPEITIKLLVTVDEEVGGRAGIGYLFNDVGIRGTAAVVVDSAPDYISVGASGALWGRFIVKGIGGHSGHPEKADNAIYRATEFIRKLKEYNRDVSRIRSKLRAPPTAPYSHVHGRFTITMIKAWEKENIIPGECEIRFDRRLVPEEPPQEAEKNLRKYVFDLASKQNTMIEDFEIVSRVQGYHTDANHPFVQHFCSIARSITGQPLPISAELGGNDGALLAKVGIPVVSYGTIRDDTNYHAHNEFVYIEDIKLVRDTLKALGSSSASHFMS
jgi:acetylornithine deacetylase/succinyl-diaminopimelate desuccinylase family protein